MLLSAFSAALILAAAPGKVPPQRFTLELPVSPETPEGRERVAGKARELCGTGAYAALGNYTFKGLEQQGGSTAFTVEQDYVCRDAPPVKQPPVAQAADPDWRPTKADTDSVHDLTMRYLGLYDEGDPAAVHALWSDENKAMEPLNKRAAGLRAFRKEAGALVSRRITKLTWYINPPAAPQPGIYAAVDYEKAYKSVPLVCGFVMWFRKPDGSYEILREEINRVGKSDEDMLRPEKRAETRALLHCLPESG